MATEIRTAQTADAEKRYHTWLSPSNLDCMRAGGKMLAGALVMLYL